MNQLTDRPQTAERELELILENLAYRKIDGETAKELIARIVGNREYDSSGRNDSNNDVK